MNAPSPELEALTRDWLSCWPRALGVWSRFTKLSPPRWCYDEESEQREGLVGSFAMIRLRDNAIVVSRDHVLNTGGLRYDDEFVRHKLLDAFGDLYLAGGPIIGCFRGVRSGHAHTRRLLAALFADDNAWSYTTLSRTTELGGLVWRDELQLAGD